METLTDRIDRVRERISSSCLRSGRNEGEVEIMAVTKTHPLSAVEAAYSAGIRIFGENRVQEAASKIQAFHDGHPDAQASFHMIGHLQSNKARDAASLFSCIESVDSIETLASLERRTALAGTTLDVLFEFFTADEDTKSGFRTEDGFWGAVETLGNFPHLRFRGLMTIAPFVRDEARLRESFSRLRNLRDRVRSRFPFLDSSVLSMGMSNDFEFAVEEGATILRLGTVLFGERDYSE
jgi:PLP dependent protein